VIAAGHRSSPDAHHALSSLCETYWWPVYAYVRRKVGRVEESRDLTQEFFVHLLEKNALSAADPNRGRFRSFLLAALNNFLVNHWKRAGAKKRGGGKPPISLDLVSAESRYALEPADELTPERLYDQQWALTLLDGVLARLRSQYARSGKEQLFEQLKPFLTAEIEGASYAGPASELGMSAGAVRVAVHRMRRRYRELLQQEIAQTVSSPEDIDDEIRDLFASLGS
jgi:RNA polymerase sigma-70 factor (ECF subfamily)